MRRLFQILTLACLFGFGVEQAGAAVYKLEDGSTVEGDPISTGDEGVMFRVAGGDDTTSRIPWVKFSQEALKELKKNPKCAKYVEPFIEMDVQKKVKRKAVKIEEWPKLDRTPGKSLLGTFFTTGLGVLALLLIYAANLYAAYEISAIRAYPWPVVCGTAAVAPVIGPIIFLCVPTRLKTHEQEAAAAEESAAAEAAALEAAIEAGGSVEAAEAAPVEKPATPQFPPTQRFARGQYTFNRRFIETKFAGFFTMVRRESEKDLVLLVKCGRGNYTATRIARISANDAHFQVQEGPASKEVMVPFIEIQEIVLKHKDSPDR